MASSFSSDEGEIIENGATEASKATTTLPHREGGGVDRGNRNRGLRTSRSRSPDYGPATSGYRSGSPRGFKRSRDDRDRDDPNAGRGGGDHARYGSKATGPDRDPRRFRVHYEDAPSSSRRDGYRGASRRGYEDLDRPTGGSGSRYDDRFYRYDDRDDRRDENISSSNSNNNDRYSDKRARYRSRSPYRAPRGERGRRDIRGSRRDGGGGGSRRDHYLNGEQALQAESIKYSSQSDRQPRDDTMSKRAPPVAAEATHLPKADAKSVQGVTDEHSMKTTAEKVPEPEPQQDWEEQKPIDEEAEIERRRRRREELLRKSRGSTPMHPILVIQSDKDKGAVPSTPGSTHVNTPHRTEVNTPRSGAGSPPMSPAVGQDALTPEAFDLANDQDLINTHAKGKTHDEDGPSAADYDPTADMKEDGIRDELRHGNVGFHGEGPGTNHQSGVVPRDSSPEQQRHQQSKDMGSPSQPIPSQGDDDDFDMFAEDFDEKYVPPKKPAEEAPVVEEAPVPGALAQPNGGGILEGDDKDGYYKIRPGEILNGRYQIQSALGRGMFSGVVRAVDVVNKHVVAIKIMRNNDALRKGGFTEIAILQKLNDADPEGKKHIVKFERYFEHKGHLCMAFENLSMNLREVLKKFGNNVGINLKGVRAYAYQIFLALGHLRKCNIVHADLKPDNILVNENRNVLKICDLGTAIDRSDAATAHNEITPYLVSRFYRAPEIILGMPYDYGVDVWSIGCTLYEMYTGKILFTGDSNNQMLRAIMEIRGKMSRKLYQRGELWPMHFDELGNFISQERDKVLGKTTVRVLAAIKPTRDLRTRLLAASSGMSDAETKELNHFHDLLDRCLNVNPDKRITPSDALKHPFFTSRLHLAARR